MTIFGFNEYREFLKKTAEDGPRGIITTLAQAAGCQRSYLSQALSSKVHLTADQLFGISIFLKLDDQEQEYLLLLLEKEKAINHLYLKKINQKLEKLKKSSQRLSKKISPKKETKINDTYYSAWYYSAIHIATSIPTLKTEKDFAKLLNLSVKITTQVLKDLKSWGLILNKDGWEYNYDHQIHLNDESLLNRLNHGNWRNFVLSRPILPEQNINYSSVFTVSRKDYYELRKSLLKFLDGQREFISNSKSEELVMFNCDLVLIRE